LKNRKSAHVEKLATGKSPHHTPPTTKENDISANKENPVSTEKPGEDKRNGDDNRKIEHTGLQTAEDSTGATSEVAPPPVDAESVASAESSVADETVEVADEADRKRDITISLVEDVLVVAAPVEQKESSSSTSSSTDSSPEKVKKLTNAKEANAEDGDSWETVEVRIRGSRKRSGGQGGSRHHSFNNGMGDTHGNSKKTKGSRTAASRRKVVNRKIAREVISSILDNVDEEVRRKKPVVSRAVVNPWKVGSVAANSVSTHRKDGDTGGKEPVAKSEKTLRDVVVGSKQSPSLKKVTAGDPSAQQKRLPAAEVKGSPKRDQLTRPKSSPAQRAKGIVGAAADQNTAPTYQETVSAVSTPSNTPLDFKGDRNNAEERTSKDGSSTNDNDEVPQNEGRAAAQPTQSDSPPLPTLLSPENANSANSSVASSLEVPHASHHHHHSNCVVDVNDVGYHLLDVCDRLSRDMSLFMSRRALALSSRRRERGALLVALQDTVSAMWPGRCHVDIYGSCATQLDLPSSDIDVVVVGLDRGVDMMMMAPPQTLGSGAGRPNSASGGNLRTSKSLEEPAILDESHHHIQMQRHPSMSSYVPMPLHLNGERVRRLAAELEAQPWAVQVNAIPTATVPVVKVLCDPSRLTGTTNGGDWMAHHQHLAAQAAAAAGHSETSESNEEDEAAGPPQQFHPQQGLLPWRGSDVMNGLLSLDITFEGPEHGGIGSTEFSARVVAEVCQEAGLHPDATPFVQVVMVLKELLGQRKLNEPYSGGLSSYALLLLVVALLRERAVIREELDRVERQRRAMAAGDTNVAFGNSGGNSDQLEGVSSNATSVRPKSTPSPSSKKTAARQDVTSKAEQRGSAVPSEKKTKVVSTDATNHKSAQECKASTADEAKKKGPVASSWASVAKKQSLSRSVSNASQGDAAKTSGSAKQSQSKVKPAKTTNTKPSTKPSFADTVAKAAGAATSPDRKTAPSKKEVTHGSADTGSVTDGSVRAATGSTRRQSSDTQQPRNETQSRNETLSSGEPNNVTASTTSLDSQLKAPPSFFAQGYNDIVEVLCSGETTAGKLLMHFLLYYGEHFDAQSTAIDVSGKHERHYMNHMHPYSYMSPYIYRRAPGSIDPVTGMLTVDPIVIYDPLEGAENNNVAGRCFAWNSVRWIFAQSYGTLSSAVERSDTPPANSGGNHDNSVSKAKAATTSNSDTVVDLMDPSSPLLRCLISF
jgi:hypothetical protein